MSIKEAHKRIVEGNKNSTGYGRAGTDKLRTPKNNTGHGHVGTDKLRTQKNSTGHAWPCRY